MTPVVDFFGDAVGDSAEALSISGRVSWAARQ